MSLKNEFKELNIVFNKLTPKAFAKELEIGQHPILKDNEQFVKFLQLYSLEFDKDKALLFAEYFLSISDDQNRDSREVIYLRIQSFVFSLKRDIEKCKKVLKNIEKNQNKFTKKIVSEVRLNLAMTARAIGDFGLAYEMYHNNIAFWGEDNSQLAIRALARTYTNLSVLYYYVTDKSRGRYFFDKAEEYIPKIDDKTIYYQYFTQSIYFKFDNNVISAEEALKLMDTIEASSVTNSISYKIYLIQYLFASKKIDKTLEITTELIENEGNLADNLLAQIVYYNLKCLYIKKEEKLFVKIFDTYYNLLSSSESLLTDFLDLFDKKITILEKAENYTSKLFTFT